MIGFEEAGRILDEACEALPKGIFEGLNGGVLLQRGEYWAEDGRIIMGLYHNDTMGRWIEIFYGSLRYNYGNDEERFRTELIRVLKHELTHHLEGRAGVRDLERQDEREKQEYAAERTAVLFNDGKKPQSDRRFRRRCVPQRPWEEET